ncbi:MAG: membrane protein [Tepidiforma sp.]|nr:MAG: membrane protein [Tepidiforma sp.]
MATQPAQVYYGGQAVIEGVMIRGPEHMAVAVRHPKGHIVTYTERLSGIYTGRSRRIPLVRGVVVLWETLALGMRALNFSSRVAFEEEDESGEPTEFPERAFLGTMLLALVFVVGVFFAAPILLAHLLERWDVSRFWVVLAEGVVRLGLFVGYIAAIGLIPDIRRVFQYHGAEHMTIHAFEAGRPLTVDEVRRFPKEHQRCGTSFLLVVVFVALVTFFVFDLLVDEGLLVRLASRILLVPFIAGVSYEVLRFGARYREHGVVRALFAPNIALQALTTKVPDDSQVEVAIASFEATLEAAGLGRGSAAPAS